MKARMVMAVGLGAMMCITASASDLYWSLSLPDPPPAMTVSLAPVKYGKAWAYSVEMDDGNVYVLAMDKVLSDKFYTDAPSGVKGGNQKRFVGGMALTAGWLGANTNMLSVQQVRQLQASGWSVVNHGYWHGGDADKDVFWSQVVLSYLFFDGKRAPAHHAYPFGSWGSYEKPLHKYGLRSGSTIGGKDLVLGATNASLFRLNRIWMDWHESGPWRRIGKADPVWSYDTAPKPGLFMMDFTHFVDPDPASENNRLWSTRLATIAREHGRDGKDDVWAASAQEVVAYYELSGMARAVVTNQTLQVIYPSDLPGSALTLVLEGVPVNYPLPVPEGGLLYRRGTTAWLTTPFLGERETAVPLRAKVVYEGEFKSELIFGEPITLAGVRLLRVAGETQEPISGGVVTAEVVAVDGSVTNLTLSNKPRDGQWDMISPLPEGAAPMCKTLKITPPDIYQKIEVWAVGERGAEF